MLTSREGTIPIRNLKVRNCVRQRALYVLHLILRNTLCSRLVKDDTTLKVSRLAPSYWWARTVVPGGLLHHLVAMIPSKVAQGPQSVSLDHAVVGVAQSEEAFHRTLNPGFFTVSVCLANITQH